MFMETKKFSDIAFHSIPKGRRTYFFLYYNPQSVKGVLILLNKKDKVPRGNPPPTLDHPSEVLRLPDPLLFCKPEGSFHGDPHHLSAEWILFPSSGIQGLNGQPLPPLQSPPL